VEDVCITWCKGLKRVWELRIHTHSALVALLCGLHPLRSNLPLCQIYCKMFV